MADKIIEFKCIKDFYINTGEKAFTKDKIYIGKKYNNTYMFVNDFNQDHVMSEYIDGVNLMDTYFVKVK